ncbi:patatin [Gigaspora margarita]|uniref:Patatin n=1 Tax=Gigaspora margarita TaxID=4874 RepID=A0A8H3WW07_GIGMA|nr:patatin [Gigaspora margarita]
MILKKIFYNCVKSFPASRSSLKSTAVNNFLEYGNDNAFINYITGRSDEESERKRPKVEDIDVRIADLFDLVSGTSTGAIIAFGLVVSDGKNRPKLRENEIVDIYGKERNPIFKYKGIVPRIIFKLPSFHYDHTGIGKLLYDYFDDKKITNSTDDIVNDIKVVIPSYNITKSKRAFFANFDHIPEERQEMSYTIQGALMREALRASTAAPTYFQSAKIYHKNRAKDEKPDEFVDGGVFMNHPSFKAYSDAKRHFKKSPIVVCSFGAGFYKLTENLGNKTVGWIEPLISLFMAEESISNNICMETIANLDPKLTYYRLTTKLKDKIDLDSIDEKDITNLKDKAKEIIENPRSKFEKLVEELSDHYIAKYNV